MTNFLLDKMCKYCIIVFLPLYNRIIRATGVLLLLTVSTTFAKEDAKKHTSVKGESSLAVISTVLQQRTITGKVTADEGRPLVGVTITIKGRSATTMTDLNGNYTMQVVPEDVLLFRFVGYQQQEETVGNRTTINIQMRFLQSEIEEVVVTGMGQRVDRRVFTGATSRISGEDAQIGGLADPSRGLEGRVSGVSVQNVSGTFGTAPRIRVRGATSIYGSSKPLWVVDGMIIEDVADVNADELSSGDALTLISSAVAGLNANDIESFQILKDGSATSIYGARAMSGVIVITTKRGTAGRSSINYAGEYTSRAVPRYGEFNIMNSQQQMSVYQDMYNKGYLRHAATSNASSSGVYGKMYELINTSQLFNDLYTDQVHVNAFLREAEYRNTNWFKELFSANLQHNHSVSMSSGNEKSQYYSSISALVDPGWTKRSGVNRYTANFNANYNITDKIKLNILSNGSYRDQQAPGTLGQSTDVVWGTVRRDFDINPYAYAMNTARTLDPNTFYTRNYAPFNILHELENNYMDIDLTEVKFQGDLKWKVLPELELGALAAIRYQTSTQHHHVKDQSNQATAYRWMPTTAIRDANTYLYKDLDDPYAIPISVLPEGGIYNRTDHKMTDKLLRFTGQYNKTFDRNSISIFAGSEISDIQRYNSWFRAWGLQYDLGESPFPSYLAFKQGQERNSPYYTVANSTLRQVAFFANATYSYDGRYVVNGTFRYEGANKLGKARSARWMPTWNISGAWNAHQEEFFDNFRPVLSHLMLKASYSLTGDRGPTYVTNSSAVIGPYVPWRPSTRDYESALRIRDPQNSELTYEKKHELNLGASIGVLSNCLNVEFDWFQRNNFDLIGIVNTQGGSGFISRFGNMAEMKSQGLELGLTGHIIKKEDFQWTSNFFYTHVTTKVTKLDNRARVIDLITGTGFAEVGRPARGLYSIPFERLNDQGLPVFTGVGGEETITAIYFQERDNRGYLKYEGPVDPKGFGSFGNTFKYKDLALNIFVTYSLGNVARLDPVFSNEYSDLVASRREMADRWMVVGDEAYTNIPAIASQRLNNVYGGNLRYAYSSYNYSTARMASGNFIRMKDVSLTYDLPKRLIAPWKINSFAVRFNATNLFLIYADKKLNGQAPEFMNVGGVAAPIPRQYTLTLRVGL
ncbi:SusC/RagA family TonB-linked outer membrane protein [Sphingobacterium psychroaquaticum]|uniref:TonB-linked outer membrane protein, SusC/RagA family n=1 Tax=Sphingobacterium psychroaquaticum TaxID=561061 RepID=A0A1X7JA36_9SPHI|nr:SusC/RagA family TonB-linked outer membrane protein [Sphingobacterium psychroaquaticum]SMG24552.1 TonB-linked outer membrane protein, SusC/RagA family [Sphingobacterium psychroaquaticum]